MSEGDELKRRARRAESDGELREAVRLYRAALDAGTPEGAGPADDPDVLARIGDLHLRLDELDAARSALVRYLDAAGEGEVAPERAAEAVRAHLEEDPHQRLAIRASRVLDRAGRTDEAVDLLRRTWETRTGRRLPAGDIEKAARRLSPGMDLGSWTPEWPPTGDDRASTARAVRAVRAGGGPDGDGRERALAGEDEDGGGDGAPTTRRHVHRYDRRPGGSGESDGTPRPRRLVLRGEAAEGSGAEPPSADDGPPAPPGTRAAADDGESAAGGGHAPGRAAAEDANGGSDLRRGLEVLEELLELDPGAPGLRCRKVQYARRLGEPGLLEEALLELGEALDEAGAHRGARLLYDEVLDRLNPASRRAEAGLRRVEAGLGRSRAGTDVFSPGRPSAGSVGSDGSPREDAPPPDTDPAPAPGASGAGQVDEQFRRRLSDALGRAPRELEHLRAAGLAALGASGEEAVPWRAHRGLGRFLLLRGRPEEAARHLAAALERAPGEGEETADLLYDLGVAHRRAGRPDEARDCFRRLADRDPGFAAAWEALSPPT